MTRGIFHDILKKGKITPIYKNDDKELFENYCPVSTLPVFAKSLRELSMNGFTVFFYYYISAVDDSKPIWLPKRSHNQPRFKLLHKPHPESPEKKATCSRNSY